jgi:hypothetical protein
MSINRIACPFVKMTIAKALPLAERTAIGKIVLAENPKFIIYFSIFSAEPVFRSEDTRRTWIRRRLGSKSFGKEWGRRGDRRRCDGKSCPVPPVCR